MVRHVIARVYHVLLQGKESLAEQNEWRRMWTYSVVDKQYRTSVAEGTDGDCQGLCWRSAEGLPSFTNPRDAAYVVDPLWGPTMVEWTRLR